jgi:hypothetical protein
MQRKGSDRFALGTARGEATHVSITLGLLLLAFFHISHMHGQHGHCVDEWSRRRQDIGNLYLH